MLFLAGQAFVGRDEIQAPLKRPAWDATKTQTTGYKIYQDNWDNCVNLKGSYYVNIISEMIRKIKKILARKNSLPYNLLSYCTTL